VRTWAAHSRSPSPERGQPDHRPNGHRQNGSGEEASQAAVQGPAGALGSPLEARPAKDLGSMLASTPERARQRRIYEMQNQWLLQADEALARNHGRSPGPSQSPQKISPLKARGNTAFQMVEGGPSQGATRHRFLSETDQNVLATQARMEQDMGLKAVTADEPLSPPMDYRSWERTRDSMIDKLRH